MPHLYLCGRRRHPRSVRIDTALARITIEFASTAVLLLVSSCSLPVAARPPALAAGLLSDNRLILVDIRSHTTSMALQLGSAPGDYRPGRLIARDLRNGFLYVLVRQREGDDLVSAVYIPGHKVFVTYSLPRERDYSLLMMGPRAGKLYALARAGADLVVTVLERDSGKLLSDWRTRLKYEGDWHIDGAALAEDESQLLVGYGGAVLGVDSFVLSSSGMIRCQPAGTVPCWPDIRKHTASGSVTYSTDSAGSLIVQQSAFSARTIPTPFSDEIADLAVEASAAYVLGSCESRGGLASVPLREAGNNGWLQPAACGRRMAADGDVVVVAADQPPLSGLCRSPLAPLMACAGRLVLVNSSSGTVAGEVGLQARPLDVAVVRQ